MKLSMGRRPIRFLLVVLAVIVIALFFVIDRPAAAADFFHNWPQMSEGKLFVVKMRPADKALEVQIVGKNALEVKWEDLDLEVKGQYGTKKESIAVVKTGTGFLLKPKNVDPSALYFQMSVGDQSEEIRIDKPK